MTGHTQGVICADCDAQVIPDDCDRCGVLASHGSTYADSRDLPDHDCEETAMTNLRWVVACPTCHAKPGQPCRNPATLMPRTYQHDARSDAAYEALVAQAREVDV